MSYDNLWASAEASNRFGQARRQAIFRRAVTVVTRRPYLLVPFEDLRQRLYTPTQIDRGIQTIPLTQIVGSVGRAREFTRDFLPTTDTTSERWRGVQLATERLLALPAVEVYQLSTCYFVSDGHHRISVARFMGMSHLEAHVIEIPMKTTLTPDMPPAEMLRAAEQAGFLARSHLDTSRPAADLRVTLPGGYTALAAQIDLYHGAQGAAPATTFADTAASWYDDIYHPVTEAVQQSGILASFANRTPADVYIWTMQHLAALQAKYGRGVDVELAFDDFAQARRGRLAAVAQRARDLARRIYGDDTPAIVERLVERVEEQEVERLVAELEAEEKRDTSSRS